ncbi:MAG: HD-GYP domain-containing protein [Fusobacteriaceae bacterium]|jgi:putative nucleotidyltransferase with HDIG domain|nr:HD-GYP domain-containing protein [Fusobacteriaceae bacterium]
MDKEKTINSQIPFDELIEGMVFGDDVIDKEGRLLVSKNTVLTREILERLKKFSSRKFFSMKVLLSELNIKTVVKLENGSVQEVASSQIKMEHTKERLVIKEKFEEMHKSIKQSFDELSRNNTSPKVKKELDNTVEEIKNNLSVNIELLNEILDVKATDEYLYNHSLNVAVVSNLIGRWIGLEQKDLDILILAGLVHDIGKLRVDPAILNKPGKLTDEEFAEMKKHPEYSYQMLMEMGYKDNAILKAVTFHHEKEDGSGYPLKISGDKITIHAKILAIADIFDAMTSNRVYKARVSPFKVLEMFQNQNFGKLDYKIIMVFIKRFTENYVGSEVILSNNQRAKIVSLNAYEITKPLLVTSEGKFIDISREREVQILDFEHKIT